MKTLFCSFSLFFFSLTVFGQEKADTLAPNILWAAPVTIKTDIEGAWVFVDGDSAGVTPLTVSLEPGGHYIRIIPPDVENWLSLPVTDSISVVAASPQTLQYSVTPNILILSSPSGAEVYARDSLIGTTPLVVKNGMSLRLHKPGYEEKTVEAANAPRGVLSFPLKKVWQSGTEESTFKDTEEKHSPLRLYLTGAATILAGATTAYFKVKADNTYGNYLQTGELHSLSETNRFDTAAGISLAATELSLGLFTYFMLSD